MSVEKQMLNLIQKVRDKERATCTKEIQDELWRLFNLDGKNQSYEAIDRRKVITECRLGILYLGDKQ